MKKSKRDRLEKEFKAEVSDRSADIDPDNDLDWHSLTVGWAAAKGVPPKDCYTFATHIRYDTDLA